MERSKMYVIIGGIIFGALVFGATIMTLSVVDPDKEMVKSQD